MLEAGAPDGAAWTRRAHRRWRHSLRARLVTLFLLLALAITAVFLTGMQGALRIGWRDAVRPLLADYVDRLVAEIGSPPSADRAQALAHRLPVTVAIEGPALNWRSHPELEEGPRRWRGAWVEREGSLLTRTTPDGHRITLGLSVRPWHDRPRRVGWLTLVVVLALTAVAYAAVRRLLRPLDDIRAGAKRFGAGTFAPAIPVRRRDELGDLAGEINAMAAGLHQMLEGKRTLLLAISHELRTPLTRARLNAELLADDGDTALRRAALLRDVQEMARLVEDLLERERLDQGHGALQREETDVAALVHEAAQGRDVEMQLPPELPLVAVDRTRVRVLLRNLLDNAERHGGAARRPTLTLAPDAQNAGIVLVVRDFGPGVEPGALPELAQPFYRTDAARQRTTGGTGLGLHLCQLIAQAHGGRLDIRNAQPGLEVRVMLPPTS
ncbi:MAG: two-component sensor histidine kinase [Ramlibacter sp.]|jgi:signal transduction histidine kinase|nr:two-component sensor histidine kinase [Ramlibacter sp.]